MTNAHRRRKQPDIVRHQLLDVAARLCLKNGLHTLTLDSVAKEAGVSKGGLLHHFPSKQALLDALSQSCLDDLERRLSEQLEKDKEITKGRFARAYLKVMVNSADRPDRERWDNLGSLFMSDASMRANWHRWLTQQLTVYKDTDDTISSLIVRLASDGLWMSDLTGSPGISQAKRKLVIRRLAAMASDAS